MDIAFTHVCVWTLLAFVLTWTVFYITNRGKKTTKLADAVAEERTDGATDVIIVGAGVGGSALAYTLAKVCKVASPICDQVLICIALLLTIFLYYYMCINDRIQY